MSVNPTDTRSDDRFLIRSFRSIDLGAKVIADTCSDAIWDQIGRKHHHRLAAAGTIDEDVHLLQAGVGGVVGAGDLDRLLDLEEEIKTDLQELLALVSGASQMEANP